MCLWVMHTHSHVLVVDLVKDCEELVKERVELVKVAEEELEVTDLPELLNL